MGYLLILTGARVDDVVELHPSATLTLGSGAEAHIQVPDEHVAPVHAQVYPAEGSYWFQDLGRGHSELDLEPVSGEIRELTEDGVLVVGRTFMKFVTALPAVGVVDEDSREVDARDSTIEELRARVASLEAAGTERARELESARRELTEASQQLSDLREEVAEGAARLARAQAELEAARDADAHVELAAALATPSFEPSEEGLRIESGLRALRERASDLAGALAMGESGTDGSP